MKRSALDRTHAVFSRMLTFSTQSVSYDPRSTTLVLPRRCDWEDLLGDGHRILHNLPHGITKVGNLVACGLTVHAVRATARHTSKLKTDHSVQTLQRVAEFECVGTAYCRNNRTIRDLSMDKAHRAALRQINSRGHTRHAGSKVVIRDDCIE